MTGLYSRLIGAWESRLANADRNRVAQPFDWGLDWLGLGPSAVPGELLTKFSHDCVTQSSTFFGHTPRNDFRLEGSTMTFTSEIETPYPENNVVHAEYFPASGSNGRAVLVIPQWNSDDQGHIGLCRLLNRFGLSALRMSKAYHHRRKPKHLERADYHVSANLGRTIHAMRQSVLDARACLDWLEARRYGRIGILGTSLGSCVTLLAAAHDKRPRAAVFNHVSMHVGDVVWTGVSCRHIRQTLEGKVTQEDLRRYWAPISPASYLRQLAGRDLKTLLIWGSHDTTFRPEYSNLVFEGFRDLGIPHRQVRLPCGHYTTGRFPFNWWDGLTMSRFLSRSL
jgi:hypothetical protein